MHNPWSLLSTSLTSSPNRKAFSVRRWSKCLAITTVMATGIFSSTANAQCINLVKNGSIETVGQNSNQIAEHWYDMHPITSSTMKPCPGSYCPDGGSSALELVSMDINPYYKHAQPYTAVNVLNGQELTLSFDYYNQGSPTQGGSSNYLLKAFLTQNVPGPFDASNSTLPFANMHIITATAITVGNWQSYSITFQADANYNYLFFQLDHDFTNPFSVGYLDNVRLCKDASQFCLSSFAPKPGENYLLSAWVSEDDPVGKTTMDDPNVSFVFLDANQSPIGTAGPFYASGEVIDGWQKVEESFLVPVGAVFIEVKLNNTSTQGVGAYFDDIRISPFDGNLVSYVYDPETLRLMAELDENNYATVYEYDEEGRLIRTKRETERGKVTVQEARSHVHRP